ncbi:hypothetical protein [Clostridium sp. Marseille-Q2269]|uniref:hypothetical protein n=1 Tax=Clostridium sp. Marseille-Q2269 TaxID=2942205 RepID=UPI0020740328|nr:hypothetical protein [Clostridium sp. Marseille-Q2269]
MTKEIISSHIFVFPFRWDVVKDKDCLDACIDKRLNVEKFIECLKQEGSWKEDKAVLKIVENEEVQNDKDYNEYTYFYDNVRKAIYGKQNYIKKDNNVSFHIKNSKYYLGRLFNEKVFNRIVRCFDRNDVNENSIYEINVEKKDDEGKVSFSKIYKLKIESIKLKVYDTGVATLSYFLENKEYRDKEDILKINDYGRRIYPQYIPLDSVKNRFLAKKLSVQLQNNTIEEDFNYRLKEKPNMISNTIMDILGEKFISVEKELECQYRWLSKKESIVIKPIIDDRMFVICYYNDNTCSRILTNFNKDEHLKSDFWYQFLFVDNDGPTCKDEKMREELLLKSTYTRWKNYGSLFGISRYSFVLLCDELWFSKNVLYNHMNTIYYEMVLLVLVQRASVLRFSDETSKISASFESKNIYEQIKKLQQYYIRFVNTIYFREVTAQEEGIELYDKLMELMRIEREVKRLDEEIDEIQRYITLETNEKTNKLLNVITFAGICVSVLTFVSTIFSSKQIEDGRWLIAWQYVPLVAVILSIIGFRKLIKHKGLIKIIIIVMVLIAIIIFIYSMLL